MEIMHHIIDERLTMDELDGIGLGVIDSIDTQCDYLCLDHKVVDAIFSTCKVFSCRKSLKSRSFLLVQAIKLGELIRCIPNDNYTNLYHQYPFCIAKHKIHSLEALGIY